MGNPTDDLEGRRGCASGLPGPFVACPGRQRSEDGSGHLLGAAGGLEAGITALVLRDQVLPPTVNLDNPDDGCDLDYVPHVARPGSVRHALSNSFGFGGTNASLLFKRFDE